MVTARELKVAITLVDQTFKKKMTEVNRQTSGFNRRIQTADKRVKELDNTFKNFSEVTLPEDIKVDLTVNKETLKGSIENWIAKDLGKGQFIARLPLKVNTSELKKSVETWIKDEGKSFDNKLIILPDTTKESNLMKSLDRFVKKYKNKISLKVDTTKGSTLVKSINNFFDVLEKEIKVKMDIPEMKTGIMGKGETPIRQSEMDIEENKESSEKTNDILKKILSSIDSVKGSIGTGTKSVLSLLDDISVNTDPANALRNILGI